MNTLFAALLALTLSLSAFTLAAIAMDRHYEQLFNEAQIGMLRKVLVRTASVCMGVSSLVICLTGWGSAVGIVVWAGMLSVGAVLSALLLTYLPRYFFIVSAMVSSFALCALAWRWLH